MAPNIPTGHSNNPAPMNPGGMRTNAALPGSTPSTGPTPVLAGSGPLPPPPITPVFWQNAGRIAADVLELYARDPKRATEIWELAQIELAELRAAAGTKQA